MRILVSPDSFKGSLSSWEAAKAMERGILQIFPEARCDLLPLADGGEGTVSVLVQATGGRMFYKKVHDPLGRPVEAAWGVLGDGRTAVVEMAQASGLPLLKDAERDIRRACTFGSGELIEEALRFLQQNNEPNPGLIIGIGGSATNDGGAGAMRALGARFLDSQGKALPPGGAALINLRHIDITKLNILLNTTRILVACDVDNPLNGPEGASSVFGPQKGATEADIDLLDKALANYANCACLATGKDVAKLPGAGATGGFGAALLFFTKASLKPGIEILLEATDFSGRVKKADFVITGEGRSDAGTARGKAPAGVARAAKKFDKPVLCISGSLGQGVEAIFSEGIDAVCSAVSSIVTLEECLNNAASMLEKATSNACRLLKLGMNLKPNDNFG